MLLKVPQLLTKQEVARVREVLANNPFQDGAASGKATLKKNLQADQSNQQVQQASRACVSKLFQRDEVTSYSIPKQIYLIFNRYDPGMEYKDHIDAALMGETGRPLRADISFTIFLSEAEDYEGGEFVLQTPYGEQRIKSAAGDAMLYPSVSLHRVDPVTTGARWAAVGWIQSYIQDNAQRQMVYQMDQLRHEMAADFPESAYPEKFGVIHQNLIRMWAEV